MSQKNNVWDTLLRLGFVDTSLIVYSGLIMIFEHKYHRSQGHSTW